MRALCAVDDEMLDVLASYEECATFYLQTSLATGTTVGGIFQSLLGGTITRVNLSQGAQGASGSTTIDVLVNGTTIFTNPSHRPSLLFSASPAIVQQTTIDAPTVPANGNVTMSVTAVQGGTPLQLRVDVFIKKAILARDYTHYALSGTAPTIDIVYVP